jgi:hypothetical protein
MGSGPCEHHNPEVPWLGARTYPRESHMAGGTRIRALYQKEPVVERMVHCTDLRSCKVQGSPVDDE